MTDNVISFTGLRAVRDGERAMGEIRAEALEALEMLACVNLLGLPPRRRQKAIRNFAYFKEVVAATEPAFEKMCQRAIEARGGHLLTPDETRTLLADYNPDAFRVALK
jgi:hypothetical protein